MNSNISSTSSVSSRTAAELRNEHQGGVKSKKRIGNNLVKSLSEIKHAVGKVLSKASSRSSGSLRKSSSSISLGSNSFGSVDDMGQKNNSLARYEFAAQRHLDVDQRHLGVDQSVAEFYGDVFIAGERHIDIQDDASESTQDDASEIEQNTQLNSGTKSYLIFDDDSALDDNLFNKIKSDFSTYKFKPSARPNVTTSATDKELLSRIKKKSQEYKDRISAQNKANNQGSEPSEQNPAEKIEARNSESINKNDQVGKKQSAKKSVVQNRDQSDYKVYGELVDPKDLTDWVNQNVKGKIKATEESLLQRQLNGNFVKRPSNNDS